MDYSNPSSPLSGFQNMPRHMQIIMALSTGVGITGLVGMLTGSAEAAAIVAGGIVLVALLVALYALVVKWFRKRKARPLERGILDNSAASPNSISEPARRARLDQLRKSFETGVEKFRASGKNLYSLPWYLLVGEPGSGKTEAVRHCNVGFPPGLQDQLQGAGGTLNMNWWFTNHAIILDTAGRLMFEEVEPGGTSEWKEFLKLLTRVRPNCPVNGMLLVIPVDSLIRDTADAIERKAGKIAQQLDSIQRDLGVRFPVFVVVTKCDLINGFREFFDGLADPQLQHQILGWSNPAPLDQAFNPEEVEKHLRSVGESLSKRRQGLLLDPVHTEDPNARRLDQVDALYAFPESLQGIAPRLRRYLEMIFVAGEWSPKPLFLRGIYFTSSMREGTALDIEVAKALGVAMEALPEGKVWERDRAYFLRDLFLNKVFREKGLVTRASNTRKLQRRRRAALMGAGFASIFILLGLTWFGARRLDSDIRAEAEYWSTASFRIRQDPRWSLLAADENATYRGPRQTDVANATLGQIHGEIARRLKTPIHVPAVFKPLTLLSDEPNKVRLETSRQLFEVNVLTPLLTSASKKISAEKAETWSPPASEALVQLVRMRTFAAGQSPSAAVDASTPSVGLEPLFRYVLADGEYEKYAKDAVSLQGAADWLYGKDSGGSWPPPKAAELVSDDTIDRGIRTLQEYWPAQARGQHERIKALKALSDGLLSFQKSEQAVARAMVESPNDFARVRDVWKTEYLSMVQARNQADAVLAGFPGQDGAAAISLFDRQIEQIVRDATQSQQRLLAQLPPAPATGSRPLPQILASRQQLLTDLKARIDEIPAQSKQYELRKTLEQLDPIYLSMGLGLDEDGLKQNPPRIAPSPKNMRRYLIHLQAAQRADAIVEQPAAAPDEQTLDRVDRLLAAVTEQSQSACLSGLDQLQRAAQDSQPLAEVCKTDAAVALLAARSRRQEIIAGVLKSAPATAEAVQDAVRKSVVPGMDALDHAKVPFTSLESGSFDAAFHYQAAEKLLSGWVSIARLVKDNPAEKASLLISAEAIRQGSEYARVQEACEAYAKRYEQYWTADLERSLEVKPMDWKAFVGTPIRVDAVTLDMNRAAELQAAAMTALPRIMVEPPTTQWKSSILQGQKLDIIRLYRTTMTSWQNLADPDPQRARRHILSLKPSALASDYIIAAEPGGSFVQKYWADLTLALLTSVGNEVQDSGLQAMEELKAVSRFPLARPEKDVLPASVPDVSKARTLMGMISAGTKRSDLPDATIGEGGTFRNDDRVEKQLVRIRGLILDGERKEFIDRSAALLSILPAGAEKWNCAVSVLDEATQNELNRAADLQSANLQWPFIVLFQGNREMPQQPSMPAAPMLLGRCQYPGDPVQLKVKSHPGAVELKHDWPDLKLLPQGEWNCLALLHTPRAKRINDTTWHVWMVVQEKDGPKQAIWLKLEFQSGPIPEKDRWPAPQGKK